MGLSNSLTSDEPPECGRGAVEREHRASRNLRARGSKSVALNSLRGQDWALGLAEGRATAQRRTGWALRPRGPRGGGQRTSAGPARSPGPDWRERRDRPARVGSANRDPASRQPRHGSGKAAARGSESTAPVAPLFHASGRKCRSARAPPGPAKRSSSSRQPTPTPYSGPAPPLPAPSQGLKTTPRPLEPASSELWGPTPARRAGPRCEMCPLSNWATARRNVAPRVWEVQSSYSGRQNPRGPACR